MAVRDVFKVSRKTFFNPRAWLNYDDFKNQSSMLWRMVRDVTTVPEAAPRREETFEEAMAQHGMSEADISVSIKNYRRFALFFALLGSLAFIYAFFILFGYYTISGWVLAMCVSALFFAQAFKYDFWSLQMRRRKLDLTFDDWKNAVLGNKGGEA